MAPAASCLEVPLVIVAAVEAELAPLEALIEQGRSVELGRARRAARAGTLAGRPALLLACGLGKTNAAQALAAVLESGPVAGVLATGVAGAYKPARLEVGDLILA